MRNVHKISSGKVNSRPVISTGDSMQTEDGLLAHNKSYHHMTASKAKNSVVINLGGSLVVSSRENSDIKPQKDIYVPPKVSSSDEVTMIALASEEIDEPTPYELEMGKMADVANVSEPEDESEVEQKDKQEKVNTVIERARAKDMKKNNKNKGDINV